MTPSTGALGDPPTVSGPPGVATEGQDARAAGSLSVYALAHLAIVAAQVCAWLLFQRPMDGYVATLLLAVTTQVVGGVLIHRTSRHLRDARVLRLGYVFAAKLTLVVFVLGGVWQDRLDAVAPLPGGDQERFYFQACDLARAGFPLDDLPSLNYTGVLFVYGAVFAAFGHNALAAAAVNSLATLVATLLLLRVGYRLRRRRHRGDWTLGLAMVVPEVVLHDVMTSRDILVMFALSVAVLSVAEYVVGVEGSRRAIRTVSVVSASLILLAVLRTTALLPAVASIAALLVFFRRSLSAGRALPLVLAAAMVMIIGPGLSQRLGGYTISYLRNIDQGGVNASAEFLDDFSWSERSIGRLLVPHGVLQAIALALPRLAAYVVAPLPAMALPSTTAAAGHWVAWQGGLVLIASLIYAAAFPLAVVSLVDCARAHRAGLALHLPFWITALAVSSGTAIIHERYRVMVVPLLWGCLWLGRTAPPLQIASAYACWLGLLSLAGVAALAYKGGGW